MTYAQVGGRVRLRVREIYIRDAVCPLLSRGASGTIKMDLLLRSLAAHGEADGSGAGTVPPAVTWEMLHDLVRPPGQFTDSDTVLKRNWVGDKIDQLEGLNLLRRDLCPGGRSKITVLRDDGSGDPYDDPGARGASYVTVLGSLFASRRIGPWGSPELAAYFAAMIAERYARADPAMNELQAGRDLGDGVWFRPIDWFADEDGRRPDHHVRVPFNDRTLRRGIKALCEDGLMRRRRVREDPRTGLPLRAQGGRYLYTNAFARPSLLQVPRSSRFRVGAQGGSPVRV